MMTLSWSTSFAKNWRNNLRAAFLAFLSVACLYHPFLIAQDVLPWSSPGSAFGAPWTESGMSQAPLPSDHWSSMSPGYSWPQQGPARSPDNWQIPYGAGPAGGLADRDLNSHEPDLTGIWHGSGGEKVGRTDDKSHK